MKSRLIYISGAISFLLILFYLAVKILYPVSYKEIIHENARRFSLEPSLVASVIHTESRFRPNAVSRAGAVGLMQLMPSTAEFCAEMLGVPYSREMLKDPGYNIMLGCGYLEYLSQSFSGADLLAAYNAGEGTVRKWIASGEITAGGDAPKSYPYKETHNYVKRIDTAKRVYKIAGRFR